jgi:hypothetical protein
MSIITGVPYFDESPKCCTHVHMMFPDGHKSPPLASQEGARAYLDIAIKHGDIQEDMIPVLKDMVCALKLPEEASDEDFSALYDCPEWVKKRLGSVTFPPLVC